MGKVLAVDYGTKRIGLAVSDDKLEWAFGRGAVEVSSNADAVVAVNEVLSREDVDVVVVGLPISLRHKKDTAMVAQIKAFARALEKAAHKPVEFEDERFTTEAAQSQQREAGHKGIGHADERAAILLLESYLTRRRDHARPA